MDNVKCAGYGRSHMCWAQLLVRGNANGALLTSEGMEWFNLSGVLNDYVFLSSLYPRSPE